MPLVFAFAAPALAETENPNPVRPVVFTSEATLTEQNQVLVMVSISADAAFASGLLHLSFPTGVLKYVRIQKTDIDLGLMQANGEDDGIVKVAFANAEEQNAGGEILGFVFDLVIGVRRHDRFRTRGRIAH